MTVLEWVLEYEQTLMKNNLKTLVGSGGTSQMIRYVKEKLAEAKDGTLKIGGNKYAKAEVYESHTIKTGNKGMRWIEIIAASGKLLCYFPDGNFGMKTIKYNTKQDES